jgi:HD-like signal output (HDOD) protein
MAAANDLDAALKNLIQRDAVQVPPYPAVAMRLQQLVAGSAYGTHDVAKVAVTDPVVTGYLLRAANSAAVRGSAQITNVSDAVARLGASEVVRIALAVSLGASAAKRGPLAAVRRRIWQEALASALLSFHLATMRNVPAQEAFVCGLLHDVGRVVSVTCVEALLARAGDTRTLPEHDWLAIADRVHVDVGMIVATKWGLPDVLQATIAAHHDLQAAGKHRPMVEVIAASDAVVAVLLAEPLVTAEMLMAAAGLNANEASRLVGMINSIASFVAGMEEISAAVPGAEVLSQVLATAAAPSPVPAAECNPEAGFPVKVVRGSGEFEGFCVRVTSSGLEVVLPEKLPEKYLVRFALYPPGGGGPFDVHAFVESCQPGAKGFDVQARLFALAGPVKDRWNALLATVARAA